MITAFLYGVTLAFGLIIPLGMQNIFIFNQGASQPHYFQALPSVVTAFVCDVILILCAVCGVSLVLLTIPWLSQIMYAAGALFLGYMGFITWQSHPTAKMMLEPLTARKQIGFAATVSLFNPHAIIDTMGVIGTSASQFAGQERLAFTLACLCVSFFWFLGLSLAGHYFKKFDKKGFGILILNKISALIMWSLAAYLFYCVIS